MNTFGTQLHVTFFGESHGKYLGIVLDGLAPGIKINETIIKQELSKRRPQDSLSTSRQEKDEYEIVSGYYQNQTTGAPLTILILNEDVHSDDYSRYQITPRPGHADYPATIKYSAANDPRGSGIFSGRMTALWMIAGAIAKDILNQRNIQVGSHILQIKDIKDACFDQTSVNNELLGRLENSAFPVINKEIEPFMRNTILEAKNRGDSVGGVVESAIIGVPPGVGEPLFLSCESYLSSALFSIPGVKGVEFGIGFEFANRFGSEANDAYEMVSGNVKTKTNNNGGLLGGMTTGMPIIFRVAIKPTSSISMIQDTVNLQTKENTKLQIAGRHDPAIVHRAVHVINAVAYFSMLDLFLMSHSIDWMRP